MGQRIIACAAAETAGSSAPAWQLVAAVERAGHPRLGDDAGAIAGITAAGVPVSETWTCPADVAIDFSLPGAVAGIASACVRAGVPLVVATTSTRDSPTTSTSRSMAAVWHPTVA